MENHPLNATRSLTPSSINILQVILILLSEHSTWNFLGIFNPIRNMIRSRRMFKLRIWLLYCTYFAKQEFVHMTSVHTQLSSQRECNLVNWKCMRYKNAKKCIWPGQAGRLLSLIDLLSSSAKTAASLSQLRTRLQIFCSLWSLCSTLPSSSSKW